MYERRILGRDAAFKSVSKDVPTESVKILICLVKQFNVPCFLGYPVGYTI